MRRIRLRLVLLAAVLVLGLVSSVYAQKYTGTITGTVTDPTGAVVPGAAVTVTSEATAATRSGTTNAQGNFTFPELSVGTYTVTVTKSEFKTVSEKVDLHVADVRAINVQLPVGASAQTVNVEAAAIAVETQTGEVSNLMLGQQVRELPLNDRNFVQLTTLMPGASVADNFDPKNRGLFAGVDISYSGAPANANQWLVDGASNNDIGSQRTILIYPSIDAIEEFKILRNSYGPEYGGGSGAQVNIVTRGGGNQFHGGAYYFGRNDAFLTAKNFFLKPGPCAAGDIGCIASSKKQLLRSNDYGYSIGGPIKTDKLFFFWSEEWNRQRRGRVRHRWVPTAAERTGDFRDLAACPSRLPKDPQNGNAPFMFNGQANVMDPARVSPGGQAYISQIALPNIADPCATDTWIAQVKIPVNWREDNIRGDYNLNKSNTLTFRYTNEAWANPTHSDQESGLWGEQAFPALSDSWNQPSKMAVAKLTSTLGSTAVNDFQFSWSANRIVITQAGDTPALNQAITAKIPTVYPNSGKLHGAAEPEPYCWCGGQPSGNLGIIGPWNNRQDLFVWKDDFSKVAGNHTFKAGMLYGRSAKDEVPAGNESGAFWGATGAPSPWQGTTGNWYSDLLLRNMAFGFGEAARDSTTLIRWRDAEFYGGDSWKIHPRLNIEYGARWSFIRPEYLADNTYSGFRPDLFNPALGSDSCNGIVIAKGGTNTCPALNSKAGTFASTRSLVPNNNHLIAPRFGFAWDVFGSQRFVLRGGIGQFFMRDPVGIAIRTRSVNPPFGVAGGGERALDGPLVNGTTLFDFAVGGHPTEGLENNSNLANNWQWNLNTEMALWKDAKLQVGWVALRGIHLHSSHRANQIAPANRLAYVIRGLPVAMGGLNQDKGARKDLFPFGVLTTDQITLWDHRGDSVYHSLQAMFSTRFTRNSLFQAAYTWSHNIANTTLEYVDTGIGAVDSYNSRAGRGNADFDRRQLFSLTLVYNLPTLAGQNSVLKAVAGGWEAGTIVNIASGPALTITGSVNNVGNPWGQGNGGDPGNVAGPRPNRVLSQPCHLNSRQWINPAAFTWDGFPLGGYPNTGPGQCAGPPNQNVDLSFDKNWNLPFHGSKYFGEKSRLQFRLEMFNLMNHPQFRFSHNNLTFDVQGATFDLAANKVRCGAGCGLAGGSPFGQTPLLSNIGNREVQYALKLIF